MLQPLFERDIVPILTARCGANVADCHASSTYAPEAEADCAGHVSFADVALGARLPSGAPTGCPDRSLLVRLLELNVAQCEAATAYVVPCDPESSYVLRKIEQRDLCDVDGLASDPMPPGTPLSDNQHTTMRRWIEQGARSMAGTPPCSR